MNETLCDLESDELLGRHPGSHFVLTPHLKHREERDESMHDAFCDRQKRLVLVLVLVVVAVVVVLVPVLVLLLVLELELAYASAAPKQMTQWGERTLLLQVVVMCEAIRSAQSGKWPTLLLQFPGSDIKGCDVVVARSSCTSSSTSREFHKPFCSGVASGREAPSCSSLCKNGVPVAKGQGSSHPGQGLRRLLVMAASAYQWTRWLDELL